jgi:hypothetical protein
MRLERRRLPATLFAIVSLVAAIVYVRRRRARGRAKLEEYLKNERLDAIARRDEVEESFVELRSLEDARTMDHTAAILQGGGGAQIYLTVPVKYIRCEQPTMVVLLKLLDALAWNDPARALLSFELAPIGSGLYAGMGGGSIVDGIWLHPRLEETGVRDAVTAVIGGSRAVDTIRTELSIGSREPHPQ